MTDNQNNRRKGRGRDKKKGASGNALQLWLNSQGFSVSPTVHVNGHTFSTAYVTVDFGTPLTPVNISDEQTSELTERLRELAREVVGRPVNVRISHDPFNGIYWASAA